MAEVIRRVLICPDHDPMNPRKEFDNVGTMYCWHSRYNLGDEQPSIQAAEQIIKMLSDTEDGPKITRRLEKMDAAAEKNSPIPGTKHYREYWELHDAAKRKYLDYYLKRHFVHLPLYLYDHSGLAIRHTPFGCRWDSGLLGFISASKAVLVKEGLLKQGERLTPKNRARIERTLIAEVAQYDAYQQGQVYGFKQQVSDDGGETWVTEDSTWGYYGYDHKASGLIDAIPDDWKNCERVEQ